jgi:hypothetical protein
MQISYIILLSLPSMIEMYCWFQYNTFDETTHTSITISNSMRVCVHNVFSLLFVGNLGVERELSHSSIIIEFYGHNLIKNIFINYLHWNIFLYRNDFLMHFKYFCISLNMYKFSKSWILVENFLPIETLLQLI